MLVNYLGWFVVRNFVSCPFLSAALERAELRWAALMNARIA